MESEPDQEYVVNWQNHANHLKDIFSKLFASNESIDATLFCDGVTFGAHKMLLAACSLYFREVFKTVPSPHPVIIIHGIDFDILKSVLNFMYYGEVSVETSKLEKFLEAAQMLKICGLADLNTPTENGAHVEMVSDPNLVEKTPPPVTRSNKKWVQAPKCTKSEEIKSDVDQMYSEVSPNNAHETEVINPKEIKTNKSGAKRAKLNPTAIIDDTIDCIYSDNNGVLISEVKCEPTTVSDPDPLEITEKIQNGTKMEAPIDIKNLLKTNEEDNLRPSQPKSIKQLYSNDSLRCNQCDKVFSHPYSLHHHRAVHAGVTECPICHAVLSRKYNLKMHMKSLHNIEPPS